MLAIEIELLTGRFVATAHHDRNQPEWPIHPARAYSAFVATWADAEAPDPEERDALTWLEALPAPVIEASDATPRRLLVHYVPDNDTAVIGRADQERRYRKVVEGLRRRTDALQQAGGDLDDPGVVAADRAVAAARAVDAVVSETRTTNWRTAIELLPGGRTRHARTYPSVTPDQPVVRYVWPDVDAPAHHRAALDRLLARVARIGHSSTLVSCRLAEGSASGGWLPTADGDHVIRATGRGQLAALEDAYGHHGGTSTRSLPFRAVRYRSPSSPTVRRPEYRSSPLSGDWFVFECQERRPSSARVVEVTRALRGALQRHADEPVAEILSGHRADGSPSDRPHAAYLGLPFVGHAHATGQLLGVAVALPRDVEDADRRAVLRAIGRWAPSPDDDVRLTLGAAGVVTVRRVVGEAARATLDRVTWARPSASWLTATPIALHRHPGDLTRGSDHRRRRAVAEAEATVADACTHVGLPAPSSVVVDRSPVITGAVPARGFPPFEQGGRRLLVHARVNFDEVVRGPLVVGSGRYFGLGLLWPDRRA